MTTLNLSLHGDGEELRDLFIKLLGEIGFFIIHQEELRDGFRVIGASAKRASQLTATMLNLFIGYIHRNRIVIEMTAHQENDHLTATMICKPYLDVVDIPVPEEKPEEKERCERLVSLFSERIREKFGQIS
jgi:hypothetical protein